MVGLKSKQIIDSAQINAKAKAYRIQAVLYGLGGLATGTVAIARFLGFDESGYDSKMNAAFDFMLIGFISLLLVAISAVFWVRTRNLSDGK